jgi:UDP-glucose 4-epimerase
MAVSLVTGGAGFIGSHTVDALVEAGDQVVVIDDLSTGKRENLARWNDDPRVELVVANVADGLFAPLHGVTARRGPIERIVHLAAQTSVVYSIDNPLDETRINHTGTVQVLDYARRTGARKVVFASSAATYGDVAEVPTSEAAPTEPLSPYGIDKRSGELWLRYHTLVHGLATVPLRFFNVYGPRQDPSSPYSGVISIFVDRALAGKELVIFGDGEQSRDFVYVADVVRAIVSALTGAEGEGLPINVATGRESTVNQLAKLVAKLCGSQAPIRHAGARAGEIRRSLARVERAAERLGFRASVELADGLARTVEWVRGA